MSEQQTTRRPESPGASRRESATSKSPIEISSSGDRAGYAEAIGDTEATGALTWRMAVPVTPARGAEPQLSLAYASGSNGAFGAGFDVGMPAFSLRTDRGVPRYDGSDGVVGPDGGELVAAYRLHDRKWSLIEDTRVVDGTTYTVTRFRPRVEAGFDLIERWRDAATLESFWKVTDASAGVAIFGRSPATRISAPGHPERIFRWLAESATDAHGNETRYHYKHEDSAGVAPAICEQGHAPDCQRYPSRIEYGNWTDAQTGETRFGLQVVFDYGEYDLDAGSAVPVREWAARPDPFSSFRAGFEIRTRRRCLGLLMVHQFPALRDGAPTLVQALRLSYRSSQGQSQLQSVTRQGYRHASDGSVEMAAQPPIRFEYCGFDPAASATGSIATEPASGPPLLDQGDYRFIDLFGDGVPGVLGADGDRLLYWRPVAAATLGPPTLLPQMPSEHVPRSQVVLSDLSGSGRLDMAVLGSQGGGVYPNNQDGTWQAFRAFESYWNRVADPAAQFLDLGGSGHADAVILNGRQLDACLGAGEAGYRGTVTESLPAGFPVAADAGSELVTFADMFGDGLQHRVRVASGSVEIWPALGWGRYGTKLVMAGAPVFASGFPAGRILFGNFIGAGPADMLVVDENWADLYPNCNGNAFLAPLRIALPCAIDDRSRLELADLFAIGRPCLAVSRTGRSFTSHYLRMGSAQPTLGLRRVSGHGLTHEVMYRPAAEYQLADRAAGEPWATRLPTPVQVVDRLVSHDAVEGSTQTRTFQYRDGYWDPVERSFSGFGEVVQQDSLAHDPRLWRFPRLAMPDDESDAECQRLWMQTGAYREAQAIAADAARRSFRGDPEAIAIARISFSPEIMAADARTQAEAHYAARGKRLRREVYGVRAGLTTAVPFSVEETGLHVRMVQPRMGAQAAVFFVSERESAASFYEELADDPRVEHVAILRENEFGETQRSVTIQYPRRPATGRRIVPGQGRLRIVCELAEFSNVIAPYYRLGLAFQEQLLEIGNATPAGGRYFTFERIDAQVEAALGHVIAFGQPFSPALEARLFGFERTYFWNEARTECLPLGESTREALACHTESAVFPESYPASVYGARVTPAMLETDAPYRLAEGYWWAASGLTTYLGPEGFFQPESIRDPFQVGTAHRTVTRYDDYMLLPVEVTDPLGNSVRATVDYQLLRADSVTDVNGTVSEVLFDPLGRVVVAGVHGTLDGRYAGTMTLANYRRQPRPRSIAEILASPGAYIQGAGSYFYYSPYAEDGTPQHQLTLVAADYVNAPSAAAPAGAVRIATAWQDGQGKEACAKVAVEADFAPPEDRPAGAGALIWIVGVREQLDPRGNPVKRYLQYFSATPGFEPLPTGPCYTYRYDALGRVVRIGLPDGHHARHVYTAWTQVDYDENDTTLGRFDYDTPTTLHHDNRGSAVMQTRINVLPGSTERIALEELSVLDIAGQVERQCDARFYDAADPLHPVRWNFEYTYDMEGNTLAAVSVDAGNAVAGTMYVLHTSAGDVACEWDARGIATATTYALPVRRPLASVVTQDGTATTRIAYTYGADAARNNVNQAVLTLDPAGRQESPDYDLDGVPLALTRRFCSDYKESVDWSDSQKVALEPDAWTTSASRNALGEVTVQTTADGTRTTIRRFLNGDVRAIDTLWAGESTAVTTASLQYNAMRERRSVTYANGVTTRIAYTPELHRLQRVVSTRAGDRATLQDLGYGYDPVGNVVAVVNATEPVRHTRGQAVSADHAYGYDAIYQLRNAAARCRAVLPRCGPSAGTASANDPGQVEAYTRAYDYDKGGNLGQVRHQAPSSQWSLDIAVSGTSNHAVPAAMVQPGHGPDEFFDASGNLLRLDAIASMRYDARNLMVKSVVISRTGGTDDADYYVYDAAGLRARKVSERLAQGGAMLLRVDTLYLGDVVIATSTSTPIAGTPTVLAQVAESAATADGFRLASSSRTVRPAAGARSWRYPLIDRQSSVVCETDQSAAIVAYREYFPYGCLAIDDGGWITEVALPRYRYIGLENDTATGFGWFEHRYYIPWLGRWLTTDPLGPADRLNLYEYGDNNPVTRVDPGGFTPEDALRIYEQLRYITVSEFDTALGIANDIYAEAYANKNLFDDETARFSKPLEDSIIAFLGNFIGVFSAGNDTIAGALKSAGGMASGGTGDQRGQYKALRSKLNKGFAKAVPELDLTPPDASHRPFEMHHLLYKANHRELAITIFNFLMATRGTTSSARIGTHEGVFHLITSGNDSTIFKREVAGVVGIIKRMIAATRGITLNKKVTGQHAWLNLRSKSPHYTRSSGAKTQGFRSQSMRAQRAAALKREKKLSLKAGERFARLSKIGMSKGQLVKLQQSIATGQISKLQQAQMKKILQYV